MRKLFLLCTVMCALCCLQGHAQEKKVGYFNSLAIGVNAGTTGYGFDIATPIGSHLALRAGVTIMPNFNLTDDVDVSIAGNYYNILPSTIEVEKIFERCF